MLLRLYIFVLLLYLQAQTTWQAPFTLTAAEVTPVAATAMYGVKKAAQVKIRNTDAPLALCGLQVEAVTSGACSDRAKTSQSSAEHEPVYLCILILRVA